MTAQIRWLSGYEDVTDNALTKKIIANDGAINDQSMKEYGQTAGSMGGAAACAAFGVTAPLIPICAAIGGWIGGLVATLVPIAKGSTGADIFYEELEIIRKAQYSYNYGKLAVKAYLVMRAEVVKEMVERGWTAQEATNELHAVGLPGGAVLARWKPIADQWRYWEVLETDQSTWPTSKDTCWDVQVAAKKSGNNITCLNIARILSFTGHIPAPPSEPIDFSLVARDEWAVRNAENHKLKEIPPLHLSVPSWSVAGYKYSTQRPWPDAQRPSDIAKAKIEKLKQIRAALPAKKLLPSLVLGQKKTKSSSVLPVVLAVGGAAALAWWLLPSMLLENPMPRGATLRQEDGWWVLRFREGGFREFKTKRDAQRYLGGLAP